MSMRMVITFLCVLVSLAACNTQGGLRSEFGKPGPCTAGKLCPIDVSDGCNGAEDCLAGFPNKIEVVPTADSKPDTVTPVRWTLPPKSADRLIFAPRCIEFYKPSEIAGKIACVRSEKPATSCTCEVPGTPKGELYYRAFLIVDPWVVNK